MVKKILAVTGALVLLLLVMAIALPFVFSGKIKDLARKEMNNQLNARSGFEDVSISFFRHFPRVSVGLDRFYITGPEAFAGDTLVSADRIDVAVNLFSLIGSGPMELSKLILESPRIHAIVNKDGQVNWDIMKASEDSATASPSDKAFRLELKQYAIRNGLIRYDDEPGNMHFAIAGLDHEGSGNFTEKSFTLHTQTAALKTNFSYAGIPYLLDTRTRLAADLDIEQDKNLFRFSKTKLLLNELELESDGSFQLVNDSTYNMDIRFKTPSNDFRSILSLVPSVYKNDFGDLETKGKAALEGWVKGVYDGHRLPAFEVKADVQDGYFKYPDLPQPVQNVQLRLEAANPDGQLDNTVVSIPKASLQFGKEPFECALLLKYPETKQYIEAAAKGNLDLASVGQFIRLASGTRISGKLAADIQAKGNLNVVLQQQPGPFEARGFLKLTEVFYASKDFPQPIQHLGADIRIDNADGQPDNTVIRIPTGHVEIGNDPVDFNLVLTHPATDPQFDAGLKGKLQLDRVKQFYNFEPGTSIDGKLDADIRISGKKSMIDKEQYDRVQSSGTLNLKDFVYKSHSYPEGLQLNAATLRFTPATIHVDQTAGSFMGTKFTADGDLYNAIGYALKDEALKGRFRFSADRVDLNKWMGQPATPEKPADSSSLQPFAIPANLDLGLNAAIGELIYDKVSYQQVSGTVTIANQTAALQNLTMKALDGSISLNGIYSTRENKQHPAFQFQYQLNGLDVAKTFQSFNTVKYLMPVAAFISGKLNSALTITGQLGNDMMPDLKSLTGNGNILLLDGFLEKFKPLESISSKLGIQGMEKISVKDIKQYFEFVNGKVVVKPFTVKWNDVQMEVGGMHGFDQSLDYLVNMKVPRSRLGNDANQVINNLAANLAKAGIAVNPGETVNLKLNMGGTISQPSLRYDVQQQAGSLAAEVKSKADSLVKAAGSEASDTLKSIKNQALKDVDKLLKEQVLNQKDSSSGQSGALSTPQKAEEAAKGLLNNLLKKKKNGADSTQKKQ